MPRQSFEIDSKLVIAKFLIGNPADEDVANEDNDYSDDDVDNGTY